MKIFAYPGCTGLILSWGRTTRSSIYQFQAMASKMEPLGPCMYLKGQGFGRVLVIQLWNILGEGRQTKDWIPKQLLWFWRAHSGSPCWMQQRFRKICCQQSTANCWASLMRRIIHWWWRKGSPLAYVSLSFLSLNVYLSFCAARWTVFKLVSPGT